MTGWQATAAAFISLTCGSAALPLRLATSLGALLPAHPMLLSILSAAFRTNLPRLFGVHRC